jgi:ATP-dependent HslUV protease ATP-binding subunit HslU
MLDSKLTPKEIVRLLDDYIIGQSEAKKNVAIALRNRWRRMNVDSDIKKDIVPNNILMIGNTGVGKTEIARRLASVSDAPFVKVEASKFTERGYVGRDVESMVRDLVERAVAIVKTVKQNEVKDKAMEVVESAILDILIPPLSKTKTYDYHRDTTIMPGDIHSDDELLNAKTREQFRNKIRAGELDYRKIEIDVSQTVNPGIGVIGGGMIDESSLANMQDILGSMLPTKRKKRKVTIKEARKILFEEEVSKLIDMDSVKDEALRRAQSTGIIFIDEIDKIASSYTQTSGPDVSREGVQRDLLPIVEGSVVNTKYGVISTDHVLFIAAGAFHVSKPSDLIPELQGRFPIRVELSSLKEEDFLRILQEPQNALIKQYEALFKTEGVRITFVPEALQEIAKIAYKVNEEVANIGARRLHTVMSHLLNNYLFDVPDNSPENNEIVITKEIVQQRLSELAKSKDLSEYIL